MINLISNQFAVIVVSMLKHAQIYFTLLLDFNLTLDLIKFIYIPGNSLSFSLLC